MKVAENLELGSDTDIHLFPRPATPDIIQPAKTSVLSELPYTACRILKNTVHTAKSRARITTWYVQVLRSPKEAFAAAMQSWRERCEKCVCLQGD